ncbi:MAG: hypothetical protein LBN21_12495 [Treponema sp.]|jgi:hypothetical protein|nr:hypothetical protein [Treponema sp.]
MKIPFTRPWLSRAIRREARENAAQGKTLNPMLDIVFKAIFTGSDKDSREARRLLLSDCTRRPVSDVKVLNNEIIPEYISGKIVRLEPQPRPIGRRFPCT